jgi:hypothetical protein
MVKVNENAAVRHFVVQPNHHRVDVGYKLRGRGREVVALAKEM